MVQETFPAITRFPAGIAFLGRLILVLAASAWGAEDPTGLRLGGHAGWTWERANSEHRRSNGPGLGIGATVALPAGSALGARASVQRTECRNRGGPSPSHPDLRRHRHPRKPGNCKCRPVGQAVRRALRFLHDEILHGNSQSNGGKMSQ